MTRAEALAVNLFCHLLCSPCCSFCTAQRLAMGTHESAKAASGRLWVA